MDARIDLTENRDFRKSTISFFLSNLRLEKFPWVKTERHHSANGDWTFNSLILTGSKEERLNKKREWETYYSTVLCDRCGKKLIPWDSIYSLCSACDRIEKEELIKENEYPMTQEFKKKLNGSVKIEREIIVNEENRLTQWQSLDLEFDELFL